jgi:hypothetical protein
MLDIRFVVVAVFFLFAGVSQAQIIKGVVTDEQGNPLPAVNVFIKNTTTGSTSEADGKYKVEVKPGVYIIVFRIMGYETIEKEVDIKGNRPVDINVVLKEQSVELNEALIFADRKDITRKVIRGARERRKFYLDGLESYACRVYRKTSLKKEYLPKEKNDTIWDEEGNTVVDIVFSDSLPQIITYALREYYSKIYSKGSNFSEVVEGENEYKAERYFSSVSVSMGVESKGLNISSLGRQWRDPYIVFHDAASAQFNLLQSQIYVPGLCEQPLLSPIAPNSGLSYNFDLEGVFYDNTKKIFKIKVTPLFPGDALFSGFILIEDSTWALRGADLSVNPSALLFCSEFRVIQKYVEAADSVLVPSISEFIYTIKDGKETVFGSILFYYGSYEVNPTFTEKKFSNEVMRYEADASDRDSVWWSQVRPSKLSADEQMFAEKIDSLIQKYTSKTYIDSLDSAYNDINIWSFLIRGVGIRSREKQSEWYFLPLVAQINPVGIGGYRHQLGGNYNKRFGNDFYMENEATVNYGFTNRDLRGKMGVGLTYVPEKFVRTFVRFGDFYDMINDYASIGSIFSRSNYVRTQSASIAQRMEIINGLFGEITVSYSDQKPLTNMVIEGWSNQLFGTLNQPSDFERYKKFEVRLDMKYRPAQKYIMRGRRKIILDSAWPEFSFTYRKGVRGVLGSEVNFDFLELGASHNMKLRRWGTSAWSVTAGSFVNRTSLRLIEHRYFRGSDLFFFSDPLKSFQLLGSTLSSSSSFFRANYMHHFEGAITNKIPLLYRLKISLAGGAGILMMEENNYRHAEVFAGIERVFRIRKQLFRIGVFAVTADDNLSAARLTYKVGINFYNPYNGKWDY